MRPPPLLGLTDEADAVGLANAGEHGISAGITCDLAATLPPPGNLETRVVRRNGESGPVSRARTHEYLTEPKTIYIAGG